MFRKKSSTPHVHEPKQTVTVKSIDYVLENISQIKSSYYQDDRLCLEQETVGNLSLFFPDNSPVCVPTQMIQCIAITNNDANSRQHCVVRDTNMFPGHYTVSITPTARGTNELSIKIKDTNIMKHPIRATVSIPPQMRSTPTHTFSNRIKYPYAVEVLGEGTLVISEYFSHRVTLLDKATGKPIGSIGRFGSGKGEFNHPSGLAINLRGNLLVADRDNHRIQEFKDTGEPLACVGSYGTSGQLRFNKPEGIAVCPSTGMVYVADCYNHRIQVLHPDLSFSHTIGSWGKEPGQFKHPFDLTFDNRGLLYVTDRCNDRVQALTRNGKCTVLCEGLDNPTGITVDDHNVLFVCEYYIDLIAVISSNTGKHVPCELQGMFKGPYGIKFNPYNGDIIVCDTRNNRVLVF